MTKQIGNYIFTFCKKCNDFKNEFVEQKWGFDFELTNDLLFNKGCYTSDNYHQLVKVNIKGMSEPICIIGIRHEHGLKINSDHISLLDVHKDFRGKGLGKEIFSLFISNFCDKPYVTLYAEEKNQGFYEKLGFVKQNKYFYVFEK